MRKGIYSGSFDPPTIGHVWMIQQGSLLFDELYVAIGTNPSKKPWFTFEQRQQMLNDIVGSLHTKNIHVIEFKGKLLVNVAQQLGCEYMLRGLRNSEDFNFETGIKHINEKINDTIQTIYFSPPSYLSDVSSSVVKGLVGFEGWENVVQHYVSGTVLNMLIQRQQGLNESIVAI